MREVLKKIDASIYRLERGLCAILFLVMSGIMFVYVAHRAPLPEDPTFAFDGTVRSCAEWEGCHS